ncbi:MAG: hypothetical protein JKY60_08585 [Kordiimonadaceae bacterium]|nr:hypothetical protein [Kordiimonadaceae bacterium]
MRLVICVCVSVIVMCLGATAQDQSPTTKAPLGLWAWSAEETQNIFSFTVKLVDGKWGATVQSSPVQVTVDQGIISVAGPDNQRFVGNLSEDKSRIRGRWYQPSSSLRYQDVDTPITLLAVKDGHWTADITVQPRPFSIFLDIFKGEKSKIYAVIRNPEGNEIQGATRFRVEAEGAGNWTLVAGSGDRLRRRKLTQVNSGELLLEHDLFQAPISLKPIDAKSAVGYYSRLGSAGPARFTAPPKLDDGWEVATPEQAGFDRAALGALVAELASSNPRNRRPA